VTVEELSLQGITEIHDGPQIAAYYCLTQEVLSAAYVLTGLSEALVPRDLVSFFLAVRLYLNQVERSSET